MGGCSSKPQTAECECRSPANRELNLLLTGLKGIDPSNPSPYKGSQHTLQSLFIQHHRDGEDVLTLQELLQDPKPLLHLDTDSAEASSKGSQPQQQEGSPISVFTDLAHQDAAKCLQTEEVLLPQEAAQKNEPTASVDSRRPTDTDVVALSAAAERLADDHPLSEAASDQDVASKPKENLLPSREPSLSPTDQVLHEIRTSLVMEVTASNVQALDAEVVAVIDRHEREVEEGQKLDKIAAESKIESTTEEHAIEGAAETKMQAETEPGKVEKIVRAINSETQCEGGTMETSEPLVVHHADCFAKSCLEREKSAFIGMEEKVAEDETAGIQAVEAEKIGEQDRESIESENAEPQNEADIGHEKGRMQYTEAEVGDKTSVCMGIVQENKKEDFQVEEKACIQDAVTSVQVADAGIPDGSDKGGTTCVDEVVTMQGNENEEVQGGLLPSKDEQNPPADDNANNDRGALQDERAIVTMVPSHVDSKAAAGEFASMEKTDEAVSCEINKEVKSDREMLASKRNTVKQADLGLTENLAVGEEKLAPSVAVGAGTNHVVIEKLEPMEKTKKSSEIESLEVTVSEEVVSMEMLPSESNETFEHEQQTHNSPVEFDLNKKVQDQALESSSSEDKKPQNALSNQKLLESDATDNLESSKIEQTVGLEPEKSNAVDGKGNRDEAFEVPHSGQSDTNLSSVKLEPIHSRQAEEFGNGLDLNPGVESDQLLQIGGKRSLLN